MDTTKTIKVANGLVEGRIQKTLGKDIVQFLSIPYCKPPVGELRFQRPEPCDSFSDKIINKLHFETVQPQFLPPFPPNSFLSKLLDLPQGVEDEDSLYVNIWCPLDVLNGKEKRAVFLYIHGGGFVCGSSSTETYDGSIMASQENIIVASFNYRLGAAGFLCLDDFIKGNMGMWDQVLAMKWVYHNISAFNGDRENITLGGCSAGGGSVSLQLIIQESWPHFSKALIQSGVCLSDWACLPKEELIRRSVIYINKVLGKYKYHLQWSSSLSKEEKKSIIKYLQSVDLKECSKEFESILGVFQFPWSPCLDGELIKDRPRTLFENGKFKVCPTIIEHTQNESTMLLMLLAPSVDEKNHVNVEYFQKIYEHYPHFPVPCKPETLERIKSEYNIRGETLDLDKFERILSDQQFVYPSIELASILSKCNENVYYILYNTPFEYGNVPKWLGVFHGADVNAFFGNYLKPKFESPDSDKEFSKHLMRQFCSFMKNGTFLNNIPHYETKTKRYTCIEKERWLNKTVTDDEWAKVAFWKDLRKTYD